MALRPLLSMRMLLDACAMDQATDHGSSCETMAPKLPADAPKRWEPACPLHRSRALLVRNAEKVSQMSPKSLGDTPKALSRHFPETLQRLPGLSPRPFGVPESEAPGDIFETSSAFRVRRARETSALPRDGLVPNQSAWVYQKMPDSARTHLILPESLLHESASVGLKMTHSACCFPGSLRIAINGMIL